MLGYIAPGALGGYDLEDAVEDLPGIQTGAADVRFLPGEMLPNNLPEPVVDFLKCHTPAEGSQGFINFGISSLSFVFTDDIP